VDKISELIHDLNSEDEKTRAFAAEDIAYDGFAEGFDALVERLLIEPSRFVSEAIVNSLKSTPLPDKIGTIIPLLYNDDAFIRNAAVDILSVQGEEAVPYLQDVLHNPDKDVRKFVLDALFLINADYCADLIAQGLDDSDINNVITAVEYLGRMEANNHCDTINRIFMDTDNILLRCTCLEAMAVIGNKESVEYVGKMYPTYQRISFLEEYSFLKFVSRQGSEIHLPLIIALMKNKGQVMHKEIINAIEGILRRSTLRELPGDLLDALSVYLQANINDINKYELLLLLSEYKNQEILSLLLAYLNPDNHLLCLGAVEGLGIYGDAQAVPYLNELTSRGVVDDDLAEAIAKSLARLERTPLEVNSLR